MRRTLPLWGLALALLVGSGCQACMQSQPDVLRLAVTTSTRDSGLLDELLPAFEERHRARVDVIAVGTGKALALGEAGEVDAVLVHARPAEDAFLRAGHGVRREDVMFNHFILLGPASDPSAVRGFAPDEALRRIAATQARFLSRGDDSGTHQKERALWAAVGLDPDWHGYAETGRGQAATLVMADQMSAYVLTDFGTWLDMRDRLTLTPLREDRPESMRNDYGVIAVDPAKNRLINAALADAFLDYLVAPATQERIGRYRLHGEQAFHPARVGGI